MKLRLYVVRGYAVVTGISVAPVLFCGTGIALNILVLSKNKPDNKVQFIDASELFDKETNNNVLTEKHIEEILESFSSKEDVKYFSKSVTYDEIKENDFDLSVTTYVDLKDTREENK